MTTVAKPRVRVPAGRAVTRSTPSAGYLRGLPEGGPYLAMPRWSPRDAHEDVRTAWPKAAARAIEAIHNNGWIAGVTEQMVSLMVGEMLRPNLKPDFSWAGWNERQAADWARLAERRFLAWANDRWACDAGGRYTLGQIQAAAVRSWFGTGEAIAQVPMIRRTGSPWGTKLRLIQSHWLSQKSEQLTRLEHGVYLADDGSPAGYHFEFRGRWNEIVERRMAARDGFGRPLIIHVFDGMAGQVRGITPFAPILRVLRNYDQLSDATLTAAMIHAIFAATIESDYPTTEVLDALKSEDETSMALGDGESRFDAFMGQKVGWHQNVDINLGAHGKIAHLMMGEKLHLHSAEHPNSTYEAFASFLLREIARCAGAMFEDLTGDYRGATYSSVRMGIAKQWPLLLYRRRHIPVPLSQGALEALLEEDVDSGFLPMPGGIEAFLANKSAICRADWRGPAKPQADDVKAAKAHEAYRNMGVVSDEEICADLGLDWEDVYQRRAFQKQRRAELDIHGGVSNGGTDMDLMDEQEPGAAPAEENA